MALDNTTITKAWETFFPYANEKMREARELGGCFAYYTTADVAVSILKNRQIWMRNARLMNDFREISHGRDCLVAAYRSSLGERFNATLESCHPGLAQEVTQLFDGWFPTFARDTFLTCLSVHDKNKEDEQGRLSMWRAYGGRCGVALILKGDLFFSHLSVGVFSSPAGYFNAQQFQGRFATVVEGIERERQFISKLPREYVKAQVFNMFRFAALSTKDPGFHEEQEWRLLTSPTLQPSPLLTSSVEVVRGTPQLVQKLNLKDLPDAGVNGLAVPLLLDRIIIGPCDFPDVVASAFCHLLKDEYELEDAENRVKVSAIPLRHL